MFFYGWVILFICFINVSGEGAVKNLFPVLLLPLTVTFGWGRAATAGIFSTGGLISGLSSPLIGALLDKIGPRLFFPLGGLLLTMGLITISRIDQYWQFVIVYACLLAIGENMISSYTNMAVLGRWFQKKRGTAIGIADAGTGIGAAVSVPVVQWLIMRTDWRHALVVFAGAIFVLLIPLNIIFMRSNPREKGQVPDGILASNRPEDERMQPAPPSIDAFPKDMTFREALYTSPLYFLVSGRFFGTAASYMINIHYIAFFVSTGYSTITAASALAATQLISIFGKLLSGAASDRIGRELTITLSYALEITAIVVMLCFGDGSVMWPVVLFVGLRGLSMGPVGIAVGAKAADLYPGPILGRIMGVITMGRGFGLALGPFLGGYLYDVTQNYVFAWSLTLVFIVLSLACFWMAHLRGKTLHSDSRN